ncbi:hypothetical protein ACJMK2_000409 [Sinanodonta woodiana]|uniref:FAD-binding PCMH-type domain-containing protein n=1 Tax=Sinanodonta woodiana TaxID=1069815 RepID=A0ABD3XQZ2_SINWO
MDKIKDLQKAIGPDPTITIENFENWGKTQRARVLATHPETLNQLKKLISTAREMGLKVRCAGAKHSWAPLFADSEQLLIYMERMRSDYPNAAKIHMTKGEDRTVDVHVMAGVSTEEFKQFELDNGINLPCNTLLTIVQTVGVIITGCHGVGKDCKCPCDYVVKMRIVDSNGQLRTYARDTHDEEMMKAVTANFGLFGVVYDLTLRLENKLTVVKTINDYFSVHHIFFTPGVMEGLAEHNWSLELFWFPMNSLWPVCSYSARNDEVWARIINKVEDGDYELVGEARYNKQRWWDRNFTEMYHRSQALFKHPSTFRTMQRIGFSVLKHIMYPRWETIYEKLTNAIHFRNYIEKVSVNNMEFAFDLSEQQNYDLIRKACQFVIEEVEKENRMGRCPLNVVMEMRWMSHSDAYLCPASIVKNKSAKDPKVVYLEILSLGGTKGWEDFCVLIGTEWMKLGGVPHLAKQWDFLPNIHSYVREKFGNRFDSFRHQLLQSGADPSSMFLNSGLEQLIFP